MKIESAKGLPWCDDCPYDDLAPADFCIIFEGEEVEDDYVQVDLCQDHMIILQKLLNDRFGI